MGNIYAVWTDGRRVNSKGDIYFAKSTNSGISFGSNIPVNNLTITAADSIQYQPVITVGATNKVYVAFIDFRLASYRRAYLSISENGGNSFAPEVLVAGFPGGCDEIDNAALPNDRVSVAMNSGILPGGWAIWLFESTNGGANFSAPIALSDTFNTDPGDPSLVLAPNGTTYAVFNDARLGNKDVYFSKKIVPVGIIENANSNQLSFFLYDNYPNPFNPTTKIRYSIPNSELVLIKIYDLLGKEVKILVNEYVNAGTHEIEFDGSSLPSGLYLCKLQSGKFTSVKKLVLLK